jgi:pimeloyl-ACP methyl ester carboxylesterase
VSRNGTIILLHGAFCASWAMEHMAPFFEAEGYDVLAPTLRYHDIPPNTRAPQALGTTSLLDYARDLDKLIAGLPEAPVVIGHSMGGLLAQLLAARTKLRAIALYAPSAPWGILPSTAWEVAAAQSMYMAGQFWNRPLKPKQWIAATHALDMLPEKQRDEVFARFVPESGLATFEIMHWGMDIRRASYVDAKDVTCPVLCIAGSLDRVNPPKTVMSIAKRYRERARFAEYKGMSHWLIGEPGWERIAEQTRDWLKDVA